ncbi:MAG: CoA transferase [Deltaproteobacteria bacterium]|nr:CoA transferase [Deltaproteobacteria bacterium]
MDALAGRRILELADATGAYCGKLLADLGAEVIRIEPPGGDATRRLPPVREEGAADLASWFFVAMNGNKRSLALDLARGDDRRRFAALAADADAIVETWRPGALDAAGLGFEALRAGHPRLVMTSITPFGQTGPWREAPGSDLVAAALGGALHVTGEADDPPVRLAGRQAGVTASLAAAAGTLIALRQADRTGRGQRVDVSLLEAVVSATHICGIGKWRDDGIVPRRNGTGLFASVPSGAYPCRDGLVYLMVNRPRHWQVLAAWIHEVTGIESVRDPLFEGPSSRRIPYRDLVDTYVSELTTRLTVEEVYHEGQRRHLAFTPVRSADAVVRDAHLAARGFFVPAAQADGTTVIVAGPPYRLAATPWRLERAAPRVDEGAGVIAPRSARGRVDVGGALAAASVPGGQAQGGDGVGAVAGDPAPAARVPAVTAGPLAGVRVLELTVAMAGPWVGRFMAACGAEVVRVESRRHLDVVRLYVPPRAPGRGVDPTGSPWFTDWNAGKRFVALDLEKPEAVALARRLAARSDVVVENNSAGVVDKLGLGWEDLRAVKPDLVMLGTSGYGDRGPQRSYVTWGPNIEALSGLATLSGFAERPCTITQYAYPDVVSALHGLVAVLAALAHRDRTGAGQYVNVAQLEATIAAIGDVVAAVATTGRTPERSGNRAAHAAPHGCYRCRGDDRWCAIAVESEEAWRRFCAAVGRVEWGDDARFADAAARVANVEALDALVDGWTRTRDADDVMETLRAAGVAAGVVRTIAEVAADPQLAARGFFETVGHLTRGEVVATGVPLGLTDPPARTGVAGQGIGRDNEYVFGEILGMSAEEIAAACARGAIEAAD